MTQVMVHQKSGSEMICSTELANRLDYRYCASKQQNHMSLRSYSAK
jgi:hypothetical protein